MGPDDAARIHPSAGRYLLHLGLWWVRTCLACYGSVAYLAPQQDWSAGRPTYWRREARRGLRDCARFLGGRSVEPGQPS